MNREQMLELMTKGTFKKVTVKGCELSVNSAKVKDASYMIGQAQKMYNGEDLNLKELAKIVVDNTYDAEAKELWFQKGDIETLVNDREGIFLELVVEFMNMAINTEDEKKDNKKK